MCARTVFMIMSWQIYSLLYAFNYVLINFERFSVVFTVFFLLSIYFLQLRKKNIGKVGWKKLLSLWLRAPITFFTETIFSRKENKYRWMTSFISFLFSLQHEKYRSHKKFWVFSPRQHCLLDFTWSCYLLFRVHDSLLFSNEPRTAREEEEIKYQTIIIN